jgi:hypothetical protein
MTLIQFRRGLEANIPSLLDGEPAITTDSDKVFIGGSSKNIELAKKDDINSMLSIPNSQGWTSTNGQDTFVITNGKFIDVNLVNVTVGGVLQPNITLINETTFKLPEPLSAGTNVYAQWYEAKIPSTIGHHSTHELNGQDEIDVTNLKNYDIITSAIGEKVNQTDFDTHTGNKNNPHFVTAAQVGTYDKSTLDTKLNTLDGQPYFRVLVATNQVYSTINADQLIQIESGELLLTNGFSLANNTITCNTDGVYKIHGALQLSGLNSNITATLKINITTPTGTSTNLSRTIRGATGWDGSNGGGVWIDVDDVFALPSGSTIKFYANIGESPRTIMNLNINAFKISKNSVSV